ncbi:MAG: transglycosylase SLT domain-containing protein [Patescibacteria group bacterium]
MKVEITAEPQKNETGREQIVLANGNSEIKDYIRSLWGDETERAFEIVNCESGWKTAIISRTNDVGLFQINLAAHWAQIPGEDRAEKILWLQNWRNNVEFAYMLWADQGWRPWVCSRIKNYL